MEVGLGRFLGVANLSNYRVAKWLKMNVCVVENRQNKTRIKCSQNNQCVYACFFKNILNLEKMASQIPNVESELNSTMSYQQNKTHLKLYLLPKLCKGSV